MSFFVNVTLAPTPRTDTAKQMSLVYAGILVIFVVTQLFTFDEFLELFAAFNLPVSDALTYALAPGLIVAELFAIPFLLRMPLSVAFRWLSMMLGWLAAALWVFISLWVVSTHPDITTIGFLGTVLEQPPGLWAVLLSMAFGVLAAWSSWGLWPGRRAAMRKK